MTQHEELIERVMNVPCHTEDDAKALAAIADALEDQSREIAALKERVEGLSVKAARYDWLRDKANSVQQTAPMVFNAPGDGSQIRWTSALYGPELDNVLDAAIAAKGERDGEPTQA